MAVLLQRRGPWCMGLIHIGAIETEECGGDRAAAAVETKEEEPIVKIH